MKQLKRYEFINIGNNVELLETIGFENINDLRDYYYIKHILNDLKVDVHIVYINKRTNLLTYRVNNFDYDLFDINEINTIIADKIKQMLDMKLIVMTTKIIEKVGYKK